MPLLKQTLVALRTFRRAPVFTGLVVATLTSVSARRLWSIASPTDWC